MKISIVGLLEIQHAPSKCKTTPLSRTQIHRTPKKKLNRFNGFNDNNEIVPKVFTQKYF